MSVWDWVEVGLSEHHLEIPAMKGSFGVTVGDAVAGFFGARHAHVFGADIKLVCDPEDMLFGKLESYLPGVAAILGGTGGNTTFVYGCNVTATYVGPKFEIRRAPSITKTTDYVIARVGSPPVVKDPPDPIDEAMVIAVTVLSVLLCAVPAALELVFVIIYKGHPPPEGDELAAALKLCAYMITSRLMALLKMLEEKGGLVQFAEQWGKEAAMLLLCAGVAALAAVPPLGWPALYALGTEGCLQNAFKDLNEALLEAD
jgi:hypothetical protein